MNTQANVTDIAAKRQSNTDPGSLSGQFRLADTDNRLKCLFFDGMNNKISTVTEEIENGVDPFGLLRFPHNGDSPLGTGLVKHHRPTVEFKKPEQKAKSKTSRQSIISMVQAVRGVS